MCLLLHRRQATRLDRTTHEQLFAGHVVGSWPMERKKKNASNDNNNDYHQSGITCLLCRKCATPVTLQG